MKDSLLRKEINREFVKYGFKPSQSLIASYYEKDKELACIQRLLFEWKYLRQVVIDAGSILCDLERSRK